MKLLVFRSKEEKREIEFKEHLLNIIEKIKKNIEDGEIDQLMIVGRSVKNWPEKGNIFYYKHGKMTLIEELGLLEWIKLKLIK